MFGKERNYEEDIKYLMNAIANQEKEISQLAEVGKMHQEEINNIMETLTQLASGFKNHKEAILKLAQR